MPCTERRIFTLKHWIVIQIEFLPLLFRTAAASKAALLVVGHYLGIFVGPGTHSAKFCSSNMFISNWINGNMYMYGLVCAELAQLCRNLTQGNYVSIWCRLSRYSGRGNSFCFRCTSVAAVRHFQLTRVHLQWKWHLQITPIPCINTCKIQLIRQLHVFLQLWAGVCVLQYHRPLQVSVWVVFKPRLNELKCDQQSVARPFDLVVHAVVCIL